MTPQFAEGLYLAKVLGQCFTQSSQKGTDGFCLQTRILKSLDNPEADCKTALRLVTFWITDRTYENLFYSLKSLGYNGDDLDDLDPSLDPISKNFHDLSGLEIQLECTYEDDSNDKPQEQWSLHRTRPPLQNRSGLRRFSRLWRQKHGRVNGDVPPAKRYRTDRARYRRYVRAVLAEGKNVHHLRNTNDGRATSATSGDHQPHP